MSRDKIKVVFDWYVRCLAAAPQVSVNFTPLVVGPSGCGKTYTIEKAAQEAEQEYGFVIPFIRVDATAYTGHGWEGTNIEDIIYDQVKTYAEEYKMNVYDVLEECIIFIDEIDKVLVSLGHRNRAWQQCQQFELLTMIDQHGFIDLGKTKKGARGRVPNRKILFIFGGAFETIFQSKLEEANKNIGFQANPQTPTQEALYNQELTWKDFETYGGVPELLNRMTNLIQLKPYTEEQILGIYDTSYDVRVVNKFLCKPVTKQQVIETMRDNKLGARAIAREAYENALNNSVKEEVISPKPTR